MFQKLRSLTRVVQWHPDPVIPEWLPAYVKASDVFFTMSEGLLNTFLAMNPNSFWLTEAWAPSFYEIDEITDMDRNKYSSDITFVGNLGSKPE